MTTKSIIQTIWVFFFFLFAGLVFFYSPEREESETSKIQKPAIDYWQVFAKITTERRYIEEAEAHYRMPVFTPELLDLSGKEVTLSGYFLPYSRLDSVIILSRFPNSSCFYCGMAGIESVAMVEVDESDPLFRTDQRLVVKGKLTLNSTSVEKLAFVIEDALVEEF